MKHWGIAIPGLAMAAAELPAVPGLLRLENPEIGDNPREDLSYGLEDVAARHANHIQSLKLETPLTVFGMSMGGMILSILASRHRDIFPSDTRFVFLVTTLNDLKHPALPDKIVTEWSSIRRGEIDDFRSSLACLFSAAFRSINPDAADAYYRYRAAGENRQHPKAFFRQVNALRSFHARSFFEKVRPEEATFIGGRQDEVLGPTHNQQLRECLPLATHIELDQIGHMVNLEAPHLFNPRHGGGIV